MIEHLALFALYNTFNEMKSVLDNGLRYITYYAEYDNCVNMMDFLIILQYCIGKEEMNEFNN